MISSVVELCGDEWGAWFPGEPAPALTAAVLTRGRVSDRATLLLFPVHSPTARLAVKLAWSDAAIAALERESQALRTIERGFPGMPARVPRHLTTAPLPGGSALVTTALDGRRWRLGENRRLGAPTASRTLARFGAVADATACGRSESRADVAVSTLAPVVEWALSMPGLPPSQHAAFIRLAHSLGTCGESFTPRWQHGDLATGNILLGRGTLGIVDWEMASPDLPPWFDLCYVACEATLELGPRQSVVRWIVDGVIRPRWQWTLSPSQTLAWTALKAAHRSWGRDDMPHAGWLDVAAELLRLPEATKRQHRRRKTAGKDLICDG